MKVTILFPNHNIKKAQKMKISQKIMALARVGVS